MIEPSTVIGASSRDRELWLANELLGELNTIHDSLVKQTEQRHADIDAVRPSWRKSASNLLHYLEFRCHDIRPLQDKLARLGLSSLGRAEAHLISTIRAVIRTLCYLDGREAGYAASDSVGFSEGIGLLESHTDELLGAPPGARTVRIMVTVPTEAATDPNLISGLLAAGMDCMRINCAHDNDAAWLKMIENLRKAEQDTGRKCRVLMDLAGPKLRTGAISCTPVVKCRPQRDEMGRVTAAARILLVPDSHPGPFPRADAQLPLPAEFLNKLTAGDDVRFTDCRGASRRLRVVGEADGCRWAESTRTFYMAPGISLRLVKRHDQNPIAEAVVGALLPVEPHLLLKKGDTLVLTKSQDAGHRAVYDAAGKVAQPAQAPCTLPEVFQSLKEGEPIWFDDGKIGGVILHADCDTLKVEITQVPIAVAKLAADKGINLPDSNLSLSALTETDLKNLNFVAEHADMVGLSFIERAEDIITVQKRLETLGKSPAIVLKIETRRAFEALPDLLLTAMRNPSAGVMIARGDLAVECGFERLAEVQEEILWICEAAHMPVIWATQVLESLAKSGRPSRAEITDAAMGERAECVMLNKGPHIIGAVQTLDNILQRMQAHQKKKQSLLRPLKSWGHPH